MAETDGAVLDSETIRSHLESGKLPEGVTREQAFEEIEQWAEEVRRSTVTLRGLPAPDDEKPTSLRRLLDLVEHVVSGEKR